MTNFRAAPTERQRSEEAMVISASEGLGVVGREAQDPVSRPRRVLRTLLGLRLLYKILIANAAIVGLCVVGVALIARSAPLGMSTRLIGLAGLVGVGASVAVNALLVRLALDPLDRLEGAAARVGAGDLDARASLSPLADPHLARLVSTFNGTLDQLMLSRVRLRTIAARALDTAEEERKRVARELHDDTAQTLASLLLRLRTVRNAPTEQDRARLLDELRDELSDATDRMRRFAQGLRPPALDMLGVLSAIEAHARKIGELEGLEIEMEADVIDGVLSEQGELALYRILQEALSNVVRHARARRVRIAVRRNGGQVIATVEDDGRGFDQAVIDTDPDRGLGLFGMEERAAYIGGRIDIRSARGEGTRVRIEIPMREGHPVVHHV